MIKNAVFSYWNPEGYKSTSGFNSLKDMCYSTALAVGSAKNHFEKISLFTNDFGKELLIDKAGIEFDFVTTELNKFNKTLDKIFWAYTKIYTYAQQKESFIHIDNDFFIWKFEESLKSDSQLIFQSEEIFNHDNMYTFYEPLLKLYDASPFKISAVTDNEIRRGLNCGIVGANNLEIIAEWFKSSTDYINNKENVEFFYKNKEHLDYINILHEQYFIATLVKKHKIEKSTKFLMYDFNDVATNETPFTHLWGPTKRETQIINKVIERVQNEYPKIAQSIEKNIK